MHYDLLGYITIHNLFRRFRKSQLHRLHSGYQRLPVHGIRVSRLSWAAHCLENQRALRCTHSVAVFNSDIIFRLKHIARVLFSIAKPQEIDLLVFHDVSNTFIRSLPYFLHISTNWTSQDISCHRPKFCRVFFFLPLQFFVALYVFFNFVGGYAAREVKISGTEFNFLELWSFQQISLWGQPRRPGMTA